MKKSRKILILSLLSVLIVLIVLSITLYFCLKPKDYTICFDVDGTTYDTVTTSGNSVIDIPINPTKDGYEFLGWFWDKDVWEKPFTADSLIDEPISSNITVYAQWTAEGETSETTTYTIAFNTQGGTQITTITLDSGATISIPANPTKDGYIFSGWFTDEECTVSATTLLTDTLSSNITLYAGWTSEETYTITFNSNGAGDVTAITKRAGESITAPEAPTKEGYSFDGWYIDNEIFENEYSFSTMPAESFTVYANWTASTYIVTLNVNGGDALTDNTVDVTYAAEYILETPTREGYIFTGWYTAVIDGTEYASSGIWTTASNIPLYAVWLSPSEGLEYTLNESQTAYTLTGIGTATDTDILIAAEYNGLPVTKIEGVAFYNCSELTSITIGSNVTEVGDAAFYGCNGLTSIMVASENTFFKSIEGVLFSYDGTTIVYHPVAKIDISYTIPDSVTNIGTYAFYDCSEMTSVTIGSGVTSIGNYAFVNCGLTSITIPDSVTSIGTSAFDNCKFSSVIIPDSVTYIGRYAFFNCINLTSVTIGNGVTCIDKYAFYGCTNLTSVTFNNTTGWYVTESSTATSGDIVIVTDTSINVTNLTDTYHNYYWKRNE